MIVDGREIPGDKTVHADICIVGAGVAGVTVAREFIGRRLDVCLLESGGLGPDRATQSLYWGENAGHPYFPLDTARTAGFGGTSNRWSVPIGDNRLGVRLRPLDDIDFEKRDWVPHSGWPLTKAELSPFYERAQAACRTGSSSYDPKDWEDPPRTPRLRLGGDRVGTTVFQFAGRDLFHDEYRREIEGAGNITTYLHANAVELVTDETGRLVKGVRVACLGGRGFRVSARLVILASGALEIPRLLLISNSVRKEGLGNEHDLVGRFFMEHPHLWSGRLLASDVTMAGSLGFYKIHRAKGTPIMAKLCLAEAVQREERLLNYCVSLHLLPSQGRPAVSPSWPVVSWPLLSSGAGSGGHGSGDPGGTAGKTGAGLRGAAAEVYRETRGAVATLVRSVRRPAQAPAFALNHMTEQAPNPESRVTLIGERDALGRNRVKLDWRLSPIDIRSIIRAQEILDEEFRRAGLGRIEIQMKDETPPQELEGGWHHMGTTRMHVDPKQGVVDENCRVHSVGNLYIAGPSVFPTCGYANPVLTFMALSIRLADRVRKVMTA